MFNQKNKINEIETQLLKCFAGRDGSPEPQTRVLEVPVAVDGGQVRPFPGATISPLIICL